MLLALHQKLIMVTIGVMNCVIVVQIHNLSKRDSVGVRAGHEGQDQEQARAPEQQHFVESRAVAGETHGPITTLNFPAEEFLADMRKKDMSLLIQFSTWEWEEEKIDVHNAILRLWQAWYPDIKNVHFTNNQSLAAESLAAKWYVDTYETTDLCQGPPLVGQMFLDSYKVGNAYWYGFTNSDIAFEPGLFDTLIYIASLPKYQQHPVMLIGRRSNYQFTRESVVNTPEDVKERIKEGTVVLRSTDFFFTPKSFGWENFGPYAVGRPLIVRAMVGYAVLHNIDLIDITNTCGSLHLTTGDGIKSSWERPGWDCNEARLVKEDKDIPVGMGHCECAKLETYYDENGKIMIRDREVDWDICDDTPTPESKFVDCLLKCRERGFPVINANPPKRH